MVVKITIIYSNLTMPYNADTDKYAVQVYVKPLSLFKVSPKIQSSQYNRLKT